MNYELLDQLCASKRTHSLLKYLSFIGLIMLAPVFSFLLALKCTHYFDSYLPAALLIFSPYFVCIVFLFIFVTLEDATSKKIKHCFDSLLNEAVCQFQSDEFEIIEVNSALYKIAFRSKKSDSNDLQSFLDKELKTMNKIMGNEIKVDVI